MEEEPLDPDKKQYLEAVSEMVLSPSRPNTYFLEVMAMPPEPPAEYQQHFYNSTASGLILVWNYIHRLTKEENKNYSNFLYRDLGQMILEKIVTILRLISCDR